MTGDELIAALQALPPEKRQLEVRYDYGSVVVQRIDVYNVRVGHLFVKYIELEP